MFGSQEAFPYFTCASCGCLQIETIPDDLARHYPDHYYSYAGRSPLAAWHPRFWVTRMRNRGAALGTAGLSGRLARRRPHRPLESLRPIGLRADQRILDVGCGDGQLLDHLRILGCRQLLGIDPFLNEDSTTAQGVRLERHGIEEIDGRWDVIMFHHSFEHMPDPRSTARAIADRLAPGGCCIVRVPTVSSWAWRHYGCNWVQLDAPRHLFLHSQESMRLLFEGAGLRVTAIEYDSTNLQLWGSECYERGYALTATDRPSNAELLDAGLQTSGGRGPRELDANEEGDQFIAYIRHPGAQG